MINHKSYIYIYVYVYFYKYAKSSKHVSMLPKKNFFLDIFPLGEGGFKISSYTIVGVHPDIKIEFFAKR